MAENVLSTVQVTFVHEATISAIQLLKVVSCIKGFCLIRKDRMAKSIWVKGDRQEKGLRWKAMSVYYNSPLAVMYTKMGWEGGARPVMGAWSFSAVSFYRGSVVYAVCQPCKLALITGIHVQK